VPENWTWCRSGITFPSNVKFKTYQQGTICCATTESVQKDYNSSADVYVLMQYVKKECQWLKYDDIIMSFTNSRELVGKTCIWKGTEQKKLVDFLL
jgi:hypothetical protein